MTQAITHPESSKVPAVELDFLASDIARLETVAAECSLLSLVDAGHVKRALMLAAGMEELERLITPAMMQKIMRLQNTSLGFKTDRDPARKPAQGKPPAVPYDVATVKRCFIESLLQGAYPVGNEWNIIAENCYLAKNYMLRRVREFPGLEGFDDHYALPEMGRDGYSSMRCEATWKLDGVPGKLSATIPVKVHDYMGHDALLGKAKRKFLARVLERLWNNHLVIADGEIDDASPAHTIDVSPWPAAAPPAGATGPVSAASFTAPRNPPTTSQEHEKTPGRGEEAATPPPRTSSAPAPSAASTVPKPAKGKPAVQQPRPEGNPRAKLVLQQLRSLQVRRQQIEDLIGQDWYAASERTVQWFADAVPLMCRDKNAWVWPDVVQGYRMEFGRDENEASSTG